MKLTTEAIKSSLDAIEKFDKKQSLYLKVVGSGSNQHLDIEKRTWFGRLLMLLGISNSSMRKIAQFVSNYFEKFYPSNGSQNTKLNLLTEKIEKFNDNHSKKIQSHVNRINAIKKNTIITTPNPQVTPQPSPSPKQVTPQPTPIQKQAETPTKTDNSKPASPAPQIIVIDGSLSKKMQQRRKTLELIKTTLKRDKSGGIELPSDLPQAPAPKGTLPGAQNTTNIKSNTSTDIDIQKYKTERGSVKGVAQILKDICNELNIHKNAGHVRALLQRIGKVVREMTVEEIEGYVDSSADVFKIRPGSAYLPDAGFTAICTTMNDDQIIGLIETIAKSSHWSLVNRRDAFYKIASNIEFFNNKDVLLQCIVSQPGFFDAVISQPLDDKPAPIAKAETRIDALLAAHYFRFILKQKEKGKQEGLLNNFIKARCANDHSESFINNEEFSNQLSDKEKEHLTNFIINNSSKDSLIANLHLYIGKILLPNTKDALKKLVPKLT